VWCVIKHRDTSSWHGILLGTGTSLPLTLRFSVLNEASGFIWKAKFFLFSTVFKPVLVSTQPPIKWVLGAISPAVKRSGHEANHSSPSRSEAKNAWSYVFTLQYDFMVLCLAKPRDFILPEELFVWQDVICSHCCKWCVHSSVWQVSKYICCRLDFIATRLRMRGAPPPLPVQLHGVVLS
jgi:hypothetical protein